MDMTICCMMPNGGTMLCHIGAGFLLFVLLSRHCEGLELQMSNSRFALCHVLVFPFDTIFCEQSSDA